MKTHFHSRGSSYKPLAKLAYYGVLFLIVIVVIAVCFPALFSLIEKIIGQINHFIGHLSKGA